MLDYHIGIFSQLFDTWEKLPDSFKTEIFHFIRLEFTEILSQYYTHNQKFFNLDKINSFEEFWTDSPDLQKFNGLSKIRTSIALGVQAITLPVTTSLFGCEETQEKAEEFSQEVANYVTSDDVISTLSHKIGKPKKQETKAQFVARANAVFEEILMRKL
ncbi:MAG: hypothetical protein SAL70_26600 [Scytonema sp. PMC 1070.18]|nr:hypothetical protein [Scytonema sp. PMC 1070.18]